MTPVTPLRSVDDRRLFTIGGGLRLPIDIASQTVAALGIRGSGKTNTVGVIAEELLDRHQPLVVIDPTNAWWGLRSGYPVFIFGGPKGDIPLNEGDGRVIAEFLVKEQVSVILSLRHLRKAAQRRFVADLCEELYHLKGHDGYQSPLTVVIDEAPLFVPQKVMGEVARTVGAVEDLIARGRNAGFGVVLISQRSATINKDVLTQCDTIITHRLPSPQDRKALAEWIEENASIEEQKEVLGSLAKLQNGEAWVWAPALDIIKRIQVRKRHTFDSSATPKVGEAPVRPPKSLAEVDLSKLNAQLAAAADKRKSEDPKLLQARIGELEAQLAAVSDRPPASEPVPIALGADIDRLQTLIERLGPFVGDWLDSLDAAIEHQRTVLRGEIERLIPEVSAAYDRLGEQLHRVTSTDREPQRQAPTPMRAAAAPAPTRGVSSLDGARSAAPVGADGLKKCARAILRVLAQFPEGCTAGKLTLLTGYRYSGGFQNDLGELRKRGLLEGGNTEVMRITRAGMALGPFEPLPKGDALRQHWLHHPSFKKCARAILQALLDNPRGLDKDQLCRVTGYAYSGGFQNDLGVLRTAGVLVGKNSEVMRAHEDLLRG